MGKYRSDFALNMMNEGLLMLQQNFLEQISREDFFKDKNIHIYSVISVDRYKIDLQKSVDQGGKLKFVFLNINTNKEKEIIILKKDLKIDEDLKIEFCSESVFSNFKLMNKKKVLFEASNVCFVGTLDQEIKAEVIYIGQAFGNEGSRKVDERLLSHSTLQRIYSDYSRKIDKEIWLILLPFQDPYLMMYFDGISKNFSTSIEEDDKRMESVFRNPVTLNQRINYVEAGLIRYFQPKYNSDYKYNFPTPMHSSYKSCYELDLSSLSIELKTEILGINLLLYSESKRESSWHMITFNLRENGVKDQLFEFVGLNM